MSEEQVTTKEEINRVAKVYIDDAIVLKMYDLQRIANGAYHERQHDLVRARAEAAEKVSKFKRKANVYKTNLRNLNAAHRLLVLENKELKRKYDALNREVQNLKSFDDVPF